jgi:hypothetical protein
LVGGRFEFQCLFESMHWHYSPQIWPAQKYVSIAAPHSPRNHIPPLPKCSNHGLLLLPKCSTQLAPKCATSATIPSLPSKLKGLRPTNKLTQQPSSSPRDAPWGEQLSLALTIDHNYSIVSFIVVSATSQPSPFIMSPTPSAFALGFHPPPIQMRSPAPR